jgi:predicted RND superfamily exporter protein
MTNPAWRSEVAPPSDEHEPNAPFFVRSIGYAWLALAVITMVGSLSFTWFRRGASIAGEMLMWGGIFSPLVITILIGPAVALILIGKWMQRRADRR